MAQFAGDFDVPQDVEEMLAIGFPIQRASAKKLFARDLQNESNDRQYPGGGSGANIHPRVVV